MGRPRRWPRRVLVATNVIVAVTLLAAGTVYGYVTWRFGQIKRISIPAINAHARPPGGPMTILVVGSDSRAGLSAQDARSFGTASQVTGQRSDTIMLVRVDPTSTSATLLSIPRDLWVPIPGHTYRQRINTTFDTGPNLLVQAIQQDLGIPIDHFVEVDFDSFRQIVNAVGGIKQYFPTPVRDAYSNLVIPAAGCYNLSGDQALAFVRSRHYEYYSGGTWHFEAESDLARIRRQQAFVRKMVAKAHAAGLTDPLKLNGIVSGIATNLTVDKGLSEATMLNLALRFRSLSPAAMPSSTLPTTPTAISGNDVLLLKQPDASQAIAQFLRSPGGEQVAQTPTAPTGSGPVTPAPPAPAPSYQLPGTPPGFVAPPC
jgi:LCP family protein required for cell wall assembly